MCMRFSGRLPGYANVLVNCGHGTLGWTLSCASGLLCATLLARASIKSVTTPQPPSQSSSDATTAPRMFLHCCGYYDRLDAQLLLDLYSELTCCIEADWNHHVACACLSIVVVAPPPQLDPFAFAPRRFNGILTRFVYWLRGQ